MTRVSSSIFFLLVGCAGEAADGTAGPSGTGASGGSGGFGGSGGSSEMDAWVDSAPPDAGVEAAPSCPAPTIFSHPEAFIPTPLAPIFRADIPMPAGLVFARIQLDIDFTRGPWASPAPPNGGMHNVFWLHRGMLGKHWLDNMVGYMNFKGHGKIELSTNLGITDPEIWNQAIAASFSPPQGSAYHATYVYDAAGKKFWFRILENGTEIRYREGVPLLDEIEAADSWKGSPGVKPGFFVEVGHDIWDGSAGPEVPTFDWVYSNLEIQFFPPCE